MCAVSPIPPRNRAPIIIELEVIFTGQTRFAVHEYFHNKPFRLVHNVQIKRSGQGTFSVDNRVLYLCENHPIATLE